MHLRGAFSLKQKLSKQYKPVLLNILQFGEVGSEFLSANSQNVQIMTKQLKTDIQSLRMTASQHSLCSLALPQTGSPHRVFVIFKGPLIDNEWNSARFYSGPENYTVYINPHITKIPDRATYFDYEYCPSFPMLQVKIQRYKSVHVSYMNEELDNVEETLTEFRARIFQHELDHLYGRDLLDWRLNHGLIEMAPGTKSKLQNMDQALQEYIAQIDKLRREYPEQFTPRDLAQLNQFEPHQFRPSWEQDMLQRLMRKCRKDLRLHMGVQEDKTARGPQPMTIQKEGGTSDSKKDD